MDYNELESGGVGPNGSDNYGGLILENTDNIASGSGDWDMEMTLSKQLFINAAENANIDLDSAYVYLYNMMGEMDGEDPDGDQTACCGFEEWGALVGVPGDDNGNGVPEPSTALIMLGALAGFGRFRRRAA